MDYGQQVAAVVLGTVGFFGVGLGITYLVVLFIGRKARTRSAA